MNNLLEITNNILLKHHSLISVKENIAIVLSGSRAVGYNVPSSDYDFIGICDNNTYKAIADNIGQNPTNNGINIKIGKEITKQYFHSDVDFAIYRSGQIKSALNNYNDVAMWIWQNCKIILDSNDMLKEIKDSIRSYPKSVLKQKIKRHFLIDFNLSVHGITYRPESENIFSVVYTLGNKVAEYCRLCCLLEGKPYPYEKWLLRASQETIIGKKLAPIFDRIIRNITKLDNDLVGNWPIVRKTIDMIDSEACDILEKEMIKWGIDKVWLKNSFNCIDEILFAL